MTRTMRLLCIRDDWSLDWGPTWEESLQLYATITREATKCGFTACYIFFFGRRKKNNFINSVVALKAWLHFSLSWLRLGYVTKIKAWYPRFFYLMLFPDYTIGTSSRQDIMQPNHFSYNKCSSKLPVPFVGLVILLLISLTTPASSCTEVEKSSTGN